MCQLICCNHPYDLLSCVFAFNKKPSRLPVYTLGTYATPGDGSIMNSMLSAVGICAEIPEEQMDAACGLAGSGPAYVSMCAVSGTARHESSNWRIVVAENEPPK